jgi:hypothetical protein
VEPSVGSLTRCQHSYKGIQKNPKKISLIFYGQKTCHVFPMGLLIGSNNLRTRLLIGYLKKAGTGTTVGELENYDFWTRYIKREHM